MLENGLLYFTIFATLLTVIAFIRSNNIMVITLLNGTFSLFTVVMYLLLDAPDVAMTEAAVSVLSSVFAIYTIKILYNNSFSFTDSFKLGLFILSMLFAAILIYASLDLPAFGQPIFNPYYLEHSASDTGIPSVVASILASYRGYDTLLETLVILIGGLSILLISKPIESLSSSSDLLIDKLTRFVFPLIMLFALYIQFHGEISPGGGFQAGSIIAVAFILYAMTFGEDNLLKFISLAKLQIIAVAGVSLYFVIGLICLFKKTNFLNYSILAKNQVLGQKIGIMAVELGVGIAVSATMLIIYLSLAYASDKSKL